MNLEDDKKKFDKKIEDMVKEAEKIGKKKGLKKAEIISNIKIAFKFFKDKEKEEILLKILGDNFYHSNDVFDCLDKEDENLVDDFILFLNKNQILIVDK